MMSLSDAGRRVFEARYAAKDDNRKVVESFEQAVMRISKAAASVEKDRSLWEEKFAEIIGNLLFVPSTPVWANVGKSDRPWQPAACFVLPVDDDLGSMYATLRDTAMVFKSGGGTGYNFSKIRPKGDLVRSTKGQASGVVELIRLYDASANMVMQGGIRRGASMGVLNVDHPEICDFIEAKLDGSLTNFNLSVGVWDSFMESLDRDAAWKLAFGGKIYREIPPGELWNMIVNAAWRCGDPGLIFLDRLRESNPVPCMPVDATNPCGEQPLSPGESCLLGSINLARMFSGSVLNFSLLRGTVAIAVRFLDNLIDVGSYPLPFIAEATRATRKIGLGFTGLADALIKAGLAYDSEEGRRFAGTITKEIQDAAHMASEQLAEEKGCFPLWERSVFYPDKKRRNASCITIAPTGSVTTMAGCEGYGVEPIFAVAYSKHTEVAGDLETISPLFMDACRDVPKEALFEVARRGSCQGVPGIPERVARIFKGAHEIAPEDHLLMQAAVQKYVDSAVSKTINLPNTATVDDVSRVYKMAYELGLKGITVFRDGCKKGTIAVGKAPSTRRGELKRGEILPRPIDPPGTTRRIDTGCGIMYATVNYDPDTGDILEVFLQPGPEGGCIVYTEATGIMISTALRAGVPVEEVIRKLKRTHPCPSWQYAKGKGKKLSKGKSCASAVAFKLEEVKSELDARYGRKSKTDDEDCSPVCPSCGKELRRAEGCFVCECGYSRC